MTQSSFDKIFAELDYWFGVMDAEHVDGLTWTLTPNSNWPDEHSFGFHFSRECLSARTDCKFKATGRGGSYRLTFAGPIPDPHLHDKVMEAALWARLKEL